MAGESRQWLDIDTQWLRSYLEEHELASAFDLGDELLEAQVSWLLSADEWAELCDAWQKRQRTEIVGDNAAKSQADEERLATTETGQESANANPPQVKGQAADVGALVAQATAGSANGVGVSGARRDDQLDEKQHMHELTQKALSGWGAFKELFRDCPDCSDVGAWETLAGSPVALFKKAERLIRMQEAKAEEEKSQTEREFEDDVTRAQNIIAGYYIYCRKQEVAPSLEHLLDFIPVMRTGYSLEAVREAWNREGAEQ